MHQGIYEELITKLVESKLNELGKDNFYIKETTIDNSEAAGILSQYLGTILKRALSSYTGDKALEKQIAFANKIVLLIRDELDKAEFDSDLIETKGKILNAVFSKIDASFPDLDGRLHEITPYTRLTYSELFTGGNVGISLDSELRKEILSADRIDLLISFIKWNGVRILEKEFKEFTNGGGKLRVITTTYMGASDYKAIELLSKLPNTEVKVSYNTNSERLHAKAYLFYRNTSFHTAYIGSSNFSKTALTSGLEWNLKITTKEISHVIDKFQKTFDTYWQNSDFELFDPEKNKEKLTKALKQGKANNSYSPSNFFDIEPKTFQKIILEQLETERSLHNSYKNLIVAATGTGKTVVSAFDYKRFRIANPNARLLYVAHRKEILLQAQATFQGVLRDNNFGSLWVDGIVPDSYDCLFASIQTLNNQLEGLKLSPQYYDYIVIDEVHHISAASYRDMLYHFEPKILLGLTATPERMDGENILEDFNGRIASEIRLPEALNQKLLCPFQYFGITDNIDLSRVTWTRGKYSPSELTGIYIKSERRVGEIISNLEKYLRDVNDVRAIGFCVTQEHAQYMAEKFTEANLKADYLISGNSNRAELKHKLMHKEINYLFVVDIFNEGVDIPEIDTVLFLRPTESLTVFLQQLGRGLRLADGKDCLSVLDFVGNARPEYDYETKFRALVGKTNTPIKKEIEDEFPHLPLGCSIVLEKKAKEFILQNIKLATRLSRKSLIQKIINFEHQTNLPLTLKNFIHLYHIPLQDIYSKACWRRLCAEAKKLKPFSDKNEKKITAAILNKWLSTNSFTYFSFIHKLAKQQFEVQLSSLTDIEKTMSLMLHYDVWYNAGGFISLEESINAIGKNKVLCDEIIELLELLIDNISFNEKPINLPYQQPLNVHARYTRDQILCAFGLSTFEVKSSNREGVAENKALNTELLFIDLIKSEENFSPTTMYDDYAINESLFHWQSQNQTRADSGKGLTYINHKEDGKRMLLFVREKSKDEFGNRMGYVFIGEGDISEYYGSKPMNIKWELKEPIPPYLWRESAKLSLG